MKCGARSRARPAAAAAAPSSVRRQPASPKRVRGMVGAVVKLFNLDFLRSLQLLFRSPFFQGGKS